MDMKFPGRKFTFLFLLMVIFADTQNGVEGRGGGGGRGGGSRGGSRGGGRSGSRGQGTGSSGRSSKTSAAVSRYKGPTYKTSYWKTGMAATTLWGLSSYRRRKMYKDHPDREPTVCFNAVKPRNGQFAYFICPEQGQSDSSVYCCGEDGDHRCCTFWDDAGRVAGVVIGVLVGIFLIAVTIIFLIRYHCRRRRRRKKHTVQKDSALPLTTVENDYSDYLGKEDREMRPVHHHPHRNHHNEHRSHHTEYHGHSTEHRNYENEPLDIPSKSHVLYGGYKVDLPPLNEHEHGYEPVMYGFRADVYNTSSNRHGYPHSSIQSHSPPPPYTEV